MVTLVVLLLEYSGWLASPIGKMSDAIWGTKGLEDRVELPPMLIVEINDDAFRTCFNRIQPLRPSLIGAMVKALSDLHPRVIGVDILSESWTSEERRVVQGLANVVWMAGGEVSPEPSGFFKWLNGKEPGFIVKPSPVLGLSAEKSGVSWAVPFFPLSDDGKVRLVHQVVNVRFGQETSNPSRTLAAALARKPIEDEAYYIAYGAPEPERFTMADLFHCGTDTVLPSQSAKEAQFRGQIAESKTIILLGGTFRESGDTERETPIGPMPGLVVNAYAIQTLMSGHPDKEESHRSAAGIDLFTGVFFAAVFAYSRLRKWNATKWAVPASVLEAFGVSRLLGREYVPGVMAVFLGILLHHVYEGWHSGSHRDDHRKPERAAGGATGI
jgi:CHASE2 domain-containing sensor protein